MGISSSAVLLFGSLALSFDEVAFHKLRRLLTEDPTGSLKWLLDTLSSLPDDCEVVLAAVPALKQPHLYEEVVDMQEALITGRSLRTRTLDHLPLTVLIPLVVASQLAQYVTFLGQNGSTQGEFVARGHGSETVGLCTGLLSAFAVAGSRDQAELVQHGAAAVRLGMLVGLAIDLGEAMNPSKSMSVGWSSSTMHDAMVQVLDASNGCYTSVQYDDNRATITAPVFASEHLQSKLGALGLTVSEMNLHGRFHSHENNHVLQQLVEFCENHDEFQLPVVSSVAIPTRCDDASGQRPGQGRLHLHALRAILVDAPTWHKVLSAALAETTDKTPLVCFGTERCVPPSVLRKIGQQARLFHLPDHTSAAYHTSEQQQATEDQYSERPWRDSDIAVVGMACKLPGADDVAAFWDLLASAKPQHQEIGDGHHERFDFSDTPTRSANDPGMRRRWFANLLSGADQFDHRFFKRSPRESASMDPAQRLMLQVAYQAVEQSGHLNQSCGSQGDSEDGDDKHRQHRNVGVFLGTTGNDYQANAASQPANAFTTTGNLQGFLAGKVSHFFGWTGPAMVVDTACSGSLVAIHQACTALVAGDCTAALAGGAHVMTQPAWFQNLAGGQFLSPTGQCKPFDAAADGYCRGEGVGAVFLKRMDRAVADGDFVHGVIAATAVQQNQNCTPIFVPNVPSLADLFRTVTNKARVNPSQISVVEAHGTGTPVGDPAEYASIKAVLGGASHGSKKPLVLGSVKGLIGHLEGSSGVVAMIKLLLMLHVGLVPPQASFTTINPALGATSADNIIIPTAVRPWDARVGHRMALINNYGASGSNASMILAQAPRQTTKRLTNSTSGVDQKIPLKYPFWLSAHDVESLHRRAKALRTFIGRIHDRQSLANMSYNVAHQSNRSLDQRVVLDAASFTELDQKLAALDHHKGEGVSSSVNKNTAIVLCFGGQVSTFVGLDRTLYGRVALLQKHLDRVNTVVRSLGAASIFPTIFQRTPVHDTVQLQVALFAMQYACARSWLDSGVQPVALVGHSFGELTALCLAQVLSLKDTCRMIIKRAALVRDAWGPDRGGMLAVSGAEEADVQKLLVEANAKLSHDNVSLASIACYNGPRSFTLAGSTTAIDAIAEVLADPASSVQRPGIKTKRLDVSHAFHCALVDRLTGGLEECTKGLKFMAPTIPIERAVKDPAVGDGLGPSFVAQHMRSPVYFHHALERLASKYATSSLVFLEAGSNSTITNMASRALAISPASLPKTHFQPVNITNCDDGLNRLVDTTLSLWRAGLSIHHWAHHAVQLRSAESADLTPLLLPPYQFDPDSRHWVDLKIIPRNSPTASKSQSPDAGIAELKEEDMNPVTFAGNHDGSAGQRVARFRINTASRQFEGLLAGHMTLQTAPICPATVQISLVVDGLLSIRPAYTQDGRTPQFQDIQYQSPLCGSSSTLTAWIEASEEEGSSGAWYFEVFSVDINKAPATSNSVNPSSKMLHTTGRIVFMHAADASLQRELAYFPRMFGHDRAVDLLTRPLGEADEVLTERNIYRVFSEIVDYGEEYRGLRRIVGSGHEAAGVVVPRNNEPNGSQTSNRGGAAEPDSLRKFDAHLSDTFCQVAGVWANFMTIRRPTDAYLAGGIGQWIRAPPREKAPSKLHVFSTTHRSSERTLISDVFVFDAADGALMEVILGISYMQIPKSSMCKLLRRMSDSRWLASASKDEGAMLPGKANDRGLFITQSAVEPSQQPLASTVPVLQAPTQVHSSKLNAPAPRTVSRVDQNDGILDRVKAIIVDLSGLEAHEIKRDSELADLGIDSLVGMELINELESAFEVKLPDDEIQAVVDMPGLMKCLKATLGVEDAPQGIVEEASSSSSSLTAPDQEAGDTGRTTPDPSSGLKETAGPFTVPFEAVMGAFHEVKAQTDARIAEVGQTRYMADALPLQNELTVALTLEAFDELGAGISEGAPGQHLERISHGAEHQHLVTYLYRMLESLTQAIKIDGDRITRTAVPLPSRSSKVVFEDLTARFPDQQTADKLTYYAGTSLARVLSGATDGVKLIFGNAKGRELAAGLYGDWPLNRATYAGLEDFLTLLVTERLPAEAFTADAPLRIVELGAGTGGTTKRLVPLLARLGVAVEYTFTDLSPSLVAAARKTWAKQYPFMRFAAHDIEKLPSAASGLAGTQHLVVASNAVHATRSLRDSTQCIRNMLRPDGFLCLVEMTRPMYWVDIVFGLFEGWWMYQDGREHVITHEERWQADLQASGYGHVDWLDGKSEESKIWKLIVAAADPETRVSADLIDREKVVAEYVRELAAGWDTSSVDSPDHEWQAPSNLHTRIDQNKADGDCVLITGGTGGLGAHLVAQALSRPGVTRVVCLNRRNHKQEARQRQLQSLLQKGTGINPGQDGDLVGRVDVVESADLSKPNLGLSPEVWAHLASTVTHIVHNAWLMHSKWTVKRFEPQLRIMANMLHLARAISARNPRPVTFAFVSSIATVGHHPLWSGQAVVPEARVPIESVLPTGYGDAKYICERLLDATLHRHPERFRTAAVRLGQIAGSSLSGYWNPAEHVPFLFKSSQTLGALPDFDDGATLGWTPVDAVASTLVDIILQPDEVRLHPVYHVESAVRQPWGDMQAVLARLLGISEKLPFDEWVRRVRQWPITADNTADGANPAYLLVDFLKNNFVRMSCGGLLMGTANAREHSPTLANTGPVSDELVGLFVRKWRDLGFLT